MKRTFILINIIIFCTLLLTAMTSDKAQGEIKSDSKQEVEHTFSSTSESRRKDTEQKLKELLSRCDTDANKIVSTMEVKNFVTKCENTQNLYSHSELSLLIDYFFSNQINDQVAYN